MKKCAAQKKPSKNYQKNIEEKCRQILKSFTLDEDDLIMSSQVCIFILYLLFLVCLCMCVCVCCFFLQCQLITTIQIGYIQMKFVFLLFFKFHPVYKSLFVLYTNLYFICFYGYH